MPRRRVPEVNQAHEAGTPQFRPGVSTRVEIQHTGNHPRRCHSRTEQNPHLPDHERERTPGNPGTFPRRSENHG